MAAAAPAASMTSSALAAVLLCAAAFFVAHAKTDGGHHGADGDLVARTCANVTSHNWGPWLRRESCEPPLRMDKRSAAAKHPRDLALIAMDLAERAAADADAKVGSVLGAGFGHHGNDDITALTLRKCRLLYATVASTIPVCRAMVEDYKPGANHGNHLAPDEYFRCARRLRSKASNCLTLIMAREIIMNDGLSELLEKKVNKAWKRADLVEAMLEEMLGIVDDDRVL